MPSIPIIMPQLGESIAEATILTCCPGRRPGADGPGHHRGGDEQGHHERGFPCPGRVERSCQAGESYPVGAVLGYLEASPADAARLGLDVVPPETVRERGGLDPSRRPKRRARHKSVQPTVRGLPVPANARGPVTCPRA